MEHSPSRENDRFSTSQEIHLILCNPKVYKSPSIVPILSQIYPVHVHHPICWKSILILFSQVAYFRFSHQSPVYRVQYTATWRRIPVSSGTWGSHSSVAEHWALVGCVLQDVSKYSIDFFYKLRGTERYNVTLLRPRKFPGWRNKSVPGKLSCKPNYCDVKLFFHRKALVTKASFPGDQE
jgi:hypothetical protein